MPTSEPSQDDIPFPLLLYEEVLLAGLLQLQQMTGAVESVDQLLAMQPQCMMPSEIGRHFSGESVAHSPEQHMLALMQAFTILHSL